MRKVEWLESVLVVGAGTMGHGIAQVFLEAGYEVTLVDPDTEALGKAEASIEKGLSKRDKADHVNRLSTRESVPEQETYELGIEAVPEQLELKRNVLSGMEPRVTDVLATNTSSIPLSDLNRKLQETDCFVGLHFMNPAPVMPLVELVEHDGSDDDFIRKTAELIESLDKTPARVMDSPGFVSNRLLMALINRAVRLVEDRVAEPEAIDQIMKMGMGHKMGPLEVADLIGLDVCLETMEIIDQRVQENAYIPADLLQEKVEEGHLGQKTGKGFYDHN